MPRWRVPISVVFIILILPIFCLNTSIASIENSDSIQHLEVVVEERKNHNVSSWTQGLLVHEGYFYESTGKRGESTLQKINISTGIIENVFFHNESIFAEGLTSFDGKLIQLTYTSNIAFVFDLDSFELIGTYNYSGEGWGLCTMSDFFVMSDGSSQLTLRDLETFESIGTVNVTKNGSPLIYLNELECVGDMVYSNVWLTDEIVMIDIQTGIVNSSIDASGLLNDTESENSDVLNGIAYDKNNSEFWLTGKYWPYLFQITFEESKIILIEDDAVNKLDDGENEEKIINERFFDSNGFVLSLMILLSVSMLIWVFDLKIRRNSEKTQVKEHGGE
ncbi:MAG: hypothetical protein CMA34_04165 [Euryarchaeota archaeon]|nr:hypothetical protein [Euryarchaeota archaeon]